MENDTTNLSQIIDPNFLQDRVSNLVAEATEFLPKVILAILGLYIGFRLLNKLVHVIGKGLEKSGMSEDLRPFLLSLINISLKIVLTFIIAGTVGIETTSIVAILGAAAFAIGIALQGSLENFAAGALVLFFKPYRVGDLIEVHGEKGYVSEIQIFKTVIITLDNKTVIIPNKMANSDIITNFSDQKYLRVDISVSMPYEEDFEKVRQILTQALLETPNILTDPPPFIGIEEFDSHSIKLTLRPYAKTDDYWNVYFEATRNVKAALGKAGVKVAYSEGIELGNIGST